MARVHLINKARKSPGKCSRCGRTIKAGESYRKWANRSGRTTLNKRLCSDCGVPRPSEQTTSDKLSQLYSAQETLDAGIGAWKASDGAEDLAQLLNDAKDSAEEVKEQYEESLENMPEQLRDADVGQGIQEKIDAIQEWVDALESAVSDVEGDEPDAPEAKELESTGDDAGAVKVYMLVPSDKSKPVEKLHGTYYYSGTIVEDDLVSFDEQTWKVIGTDHEGSIVVEEADEETEEMEQWAEDARSKAQDACDSLSI